LIDNSQTGVAAMSISSVISQRQNPYAVAASTTSAASSASNAAAPKEGVATKSNVSTVTISPEAKRLFEQSQAAADQPVDDLHDEAKYNVPEMKQGVLYNVDKWIDTHMSAEDKQVLGFPVASGAGSAETDALHQLGLAILDKRNLGYLKGPLTKQYLTDEGPYGVGNVKKWAEFQTVAGQNLLNQIFSRAS
jgi:lipoprotein-anchoring transpeptidase ErfK/SrfK